DSDLMPRFNSIYPKVVMQVDDLKERAWTEAENLKITDIDIPSPAEIATVLKEYKVSMTEPDPEEKNHHDDPQHPLTADPEVRK
ncbi:MAG: hypothetical protein K2M62_09025, partial [Muribaculaceae bacterium]|nr:hypothetical protein [Muribaculaceae bacterium]